MLLRFYALTFHHVFFGMPKKTQRNVDLTRHANVMFSMSQFQRPFDKVKDACVPLAKD